MKETFCDKEIYVVGLRRGGIHAILYWILSNLEKKTIYFPDLKFKPTFYPFQNKEYYVNGNADKPFECCDNLIFDFQDDAGILDFYDELNLPRQQFESETCKDKYDALSSQKIFIFVMRDLLNNIASRFRLFKNSAEEPNIFCKVHEERWKNFAKQYLKEKFKIKASNEKQVVIYYDRWFTDLEYRQEICKFIGIPFSDKGLRKVSRWGGGSSFDSLAYDRQAHKMNVLKRYEQLQNNSQFLDFIKSCNFSEETKSLYETLTGRSKLL